MSIKIDNIELTQEHIGYGVIYQSFPGSEREDGVITSFNNKNVFVRYELP